MSDLTQVRVHGGLSVYLCGPMTGLPEHNFPAFNAMADELRGLGHTVFNPAENAGDGDGATVEGSLGRAHFIRLDIFAIIGYGWDDAKVDAVVVLPGWESSRGARLEVEIALQLDIPVVWADDFNMVAEEYLYEVAHGNLEWKCETYLSPLNNGVAA